MYSDEVKAAAKGSFEVALKDKVGFIAERSWPNNVRNFLKDLNEIIYAGGVMSVTGASQLSEDELTAVANYLVPLRILGMAVECRDHLVSVLAAHGVEAGIFTAET